MARLKSTSYQGQGLRSRANESKGSRKKELNKLARVDHNNYENAPARIKKKIDKSYDNHDHRAFEKNHGKFI